MDSFMASFSSDEVSACKSSDSLLCGVGNEIFNVLLEAAFVIVGVVVSSKLWNRLIRKKVVPRKSVATAPKSEALGRVFKGGLPCEVRSAGHWESPPSAEGQLGSAAMAKYRLLLRGYAASQDVTSILRTLKVLTKQQLPADDIEEILDAVLLRFPTNSPTSATSILRIWEALIDVGVRPSKKTLTVVLNLLLETDSWELALSFVRAMPRRFGVPAEATHYAKLGWSCKGKGNDAAASKVCEAMLKDLGEDAVEETLPSRRFRDCFSKAAAPVQQQRHSANSITSSSTASDASDPDALQFKRLFAQFVFVNRLDQEKANLQRLSNKQLRWIMDRDFLLQGYGGESCCSASASEVLVQLMREAVQKPDDFWKSYPTVEDTRARLARFMTLNAVDSRCEQMLQDLPADLAQKVMDHEFVVKVDPSRGTSSAKVVGHVLRFRRQSMETAEN
jgi:hypothetical protein